MSSPLVVGLHRPGRTPLHRLPAGTKLFGLAAFSLAVVLVRDVRAAFAFLAGALLLAVAARLPVRSVTRALRTVLVIAAVAGAFQWWFYGRDKAVETFVDLLALTLAALVVSTTTPVNGMLDALVRGVRPLRWLVDPERVALTITLAIGALPGTVALALETRDAARARGLGRHPRAYLTPFVIRVVSRAHETGDALQARGLGDD